MLIPKETRREKYNQMAQNNDERVRDYIEVRANDVRPSRVLVICQLGLEIELTRLGVPDNVDVQHFGNIVGKNTWNEVALLIGIGRTDPGPQEIEKLARALFGADIASAVGQWYPNIERGVRMHDGRIAALESPCHPDPRAEAVRWSICEAQLMQAIGRGRAVNRTADNPLQIDILTNYALPIVVDEFTTWQLIQPTSADIMRTRGVVPLNYRDMAATYPDLFPTGEAARKALERENPGQTPIEKYIIGVCPGFCALGYRRVGSRGPASKLLFDRKRVDPVAWLTERIGEIKVTGGTPISFKEYLNRRRRTDTPEGDFVEDAKRDRNLPDATTWEELEMYLWHRRAVPVIHPRRSGPP
jgi:putative DNA primase/helicase